MGVIVLDNSVAMRWLLASQSASDQSYAESVPRPLAKAEAIVPSLWRLEAANVLPTASNTNELETAEIERFTIQLEKLPIKVDTLSANQVFSRTMALARAYNLSSDDAAYREPAFRESIPIATLDTALLQAARKSHVQMFLR